MAEQQARRHAGGATMVELLLALPVVLLLGLGIIQYTLVYQAKHALDYALAQAARQGAVDHASIASIQQGLALGLAPYLYGAGNWTQLLEAEGRAREHIQQGAAAGWIRLRQQSPSQESFDDWAEPALDVMGETIPGLVEIANDNLDSRRLRMQPALGVAGLHLSEPVGQRSGQSLADANLLRLELVYGMRLVVPLVGAIVLRTLSAWNGCTAGQAPGTAGGSVGAISPTTGSAFERSPQRLGLLLLGPVDALERTQPWMCDFLNSGSGRIPIRVSATMRMMSPARLSGMTRSRSSVASGRSSVLSAPLETAAGSAGSDRSGGDEAAPVASGGRAGERGADISKPPASARTGLANGFLSIGGDRPYGMPGNHPALCPT